MWLPACVPPSPGPAKPRPPRSPRDSDADSSPQTTHGGRPRSWNPKAPRSTTRPWAQGPRPCPSFGVPGSPTVGPTVELHITALWLAGRANAMASESPVTGEAQHTALLCPHHLANLHSSPNGSTKRTSTQTAPGRCRFPAQPAGQRVLPATRAACLLCCLWSHSPRPDLLRAPQGPAALQGLASPEKRGNNRTH